MEEFAVVMILLYDELIIANYKRTSSSVSFFIKQRIKLWDKAYL